MSFKKQIFHEKITFDGEKFGNTQLGLVYKINQESGANKSRIGDVLMSFTRTFFEKQES